MTKFTSPHNLPIIEPATDFIKSANSTSALAGAINSLSLSTGSALSVAEENAKTAAVTEAVEDANAYTDQTVNTSNLDLDTDGTPYFSPGSMTYRIFMDTDGVPYFREI